MRDTTCFCVNLCIMVCYEVLWCVPGVMLRYGVEKCIADLRGIVCMYGLVCCILDVVIWRDIECKDMLRCVKVCNCDSFRTCVYMCYYFWGLSSDVLYCDVV